MSVERNSSLEELGWTDDFSQFKDKVEDVFGSIDKMAWSAPDVYAHQVLSHGFMEFAAVRDLFAKTQGDFENIREDYNSWYEGHNLPEELQEAGWTAFIED